MPKDAHDGRKHGKVDGVGARERELLRQKKGKADCGKPFERVYEENRIAPPFSQDAENIRRPDVPASGRTDIDPSYPAGKITCREGAEQVAQKANEKR